MKQIVLLFRLVLFIGIVGIVIVIFGYHFLLHSVNIVNKQNIVHCASSVGQTTIDINATGFNPKKVVMSVCSTLVFQNTDTKYHQPAFGPHANHLLYPGFHEQEMKPGSINRVVMTAFGTFTIHDHIYDELQGVITVVE